MTSDIQAWRERRAPDVPTIEHPCRLSETEVASLMSRESDRMLSQLIRDGVMDGAMLDDGFYVKDEDLVQNFVTTFSPIDMINAISPSRRVQAMLESLGDTIRAFIKAFRLSGQIVAMRHIKTIIYQDTMKYGSYYLEIHFKYAAFKRL